MFVIAFVVLYDFGVFKNMFSAMAHDAVFLGNNESENMFFLKDSNNLMYILTNSEKIPVSVPAPEIKKAEEKNNEPKTDNQIAVIDENEPDNVDFSKEKSSISVVNNNIIVSNAAKKSFNIERLLNIPLNYKKTEA